MQKPETKPPATAPQAPARAVATNTDQRAADSPHSHIPGAHTDLRRE